MTGQPPEAGQLARLRAMLQVVLPNNPFYRTRFTDAGLSEKVESLTSFLDAAPFTSKQELVDDQALHPPDRA